MKPGDRATLLQRMPLLNNIIDTDILQEFEAALVDPDKESSAKVWIQKNKEILNGRFGKKQETPLYR